MTETAQERTSPSPLEVLIDEAEARLIRDDRTAWFMLGYQFGRAVEADRSILLDPDRIRGIARRFVDVGDVGSRPPVSQRRRAA